MKRRDFLKISTTTAVATALVPLSGCGGSGASHPNHSNQSDSTQASTETSTEVQIAVDDIESKRWPAATPSEPIQGATSLTQQSSLALSNQSENGLLFQHGVASGDPLPNRVVLWTRLTIPNKGNTNPYNRYDEHIFYHEPALQAYRRVFINDVTQTVFDQIHSADDYVFEVIWEVATDENMANIVAHGYTKAKKSKDFTVKVDPILPKANTTYYYRFRALGWTSPVGRTKTTPAFDTQLDRAKFALFSCSDHESGHFNAYANVAKQKDIDAVIHVGDYVYETGYKLGMTQRGHPHDNTLTSKPTELRSFRGRFSQYRLDSDLQECHRQHPFIVVWDDHEFRDNFYTNDSNTAWQNIKKNAPQAFEEWMPIRKIINPEDADEFLLYRSFSYGKLLSLSMLDSRRYRSAPDANKVDDSNRTMLGAKQQAWLLDDLKHHEQRGCQWKVVGQQLIFSPSVGGGKGANEGYGEDIWNGYAHNRQLILDSVKTNPIQNFVVLSGDWHTGMAFDIAPSPFASNSAYDPASGSGSLGVEIVSPAVTSAVYRDGGSSDAQSKNPHMRFHNDSKNGYVLLEFTPEHCQGDFRLLNSLNKDDALETNVSLRTLSGQNHLQAHAQQMAVESDAVALVSDSLKSARYT